MLISKEEVERGSLDKLILKDLKSKKLRIPVDKAPTAPQNSNHLEC